MRSRRCKAKETAENEQNRSIRSVWRICGMLASLCCLCVLLSACSKKYLVTVNMNGGSLVSGELIQMVREGEAAAPPAVENKDQRLSWDRDFSIQAEIQAVLDLLVDRERHGEGLIQRLARNNREFEESSFL